MNDYIYIYVKCLGGCVVLPDVTKAQYLRTVTDMPFLWYPCGQSFVNPVFSSVLLLFIAIAHFHHCHFIPDPYHSLPGLW